MTAENSDFYVLGGTIPRDSPAYVVRKADEELLDGLRRGQFCYVLTSRQMGKSSLMVRTAMRLRQEQITCVVLDLTSVGQNLTAEQWYDGLLNRIAMQLDLEDALDDFWMAQKRLGPLQRWMEALKAVVLKQIPGRIVLFVDEIDAVRSLPFSADEFFAAIRECYNRRTEDPDYERLAFCLIGVATPSDLISDPRTTPFNIGRRIELTDFTLEEAAPLTEGWEQGIGCRVSGVGAGNRTETSKRLLEQVLYWTGGHPYLTQRLCQAVAEAHFPSSPTPDTRHPIPALVDHQCEELFLAPGARERDANLLFVRDRILRSEVDRMGLLETYGQVQAGKKVKDDETNPLLSILRLSGIVQAEGANLRVRNRIYAQAFDRAWIRANMPDAELRRQKMAYQRGLFRAAAASAVIIMITSALALMAVRQSRLAQQNAQIARVETQKAQQERSRAEREAELARRNLYAVNMSLAQQAWNEKNYGRARQLLEELKPEPGQSDLRGFEWGFLWRRGHFDQPFLPRQSSYVYTQVAFSADGKLLRTDDGHGDIAFWDAATGQAIPKPADWEPAPEYDPLSLLRSRMGRRLENPKLQKEISMGLHYNGISVSPDGNTLITRTSTESSEVQGPLNLWDTRSYLTPTPRVTILPDGQFPMAFSPDSKRLAAYSYANGSGIKLYDLTTSREPRTLPGTADEATLTADGKILATRGSTERSVTLWDARTLQPLRTLQDKDPSPALLPDGETLVKKGEFGELVFLDSKTGTEKERLIVGDPVETGLVFSPDSKAVAQGGYGKELTLFNVATRMALHTFPKALRAPAFSPDGKVLASWEQERGVVLYDTGTGKPIGTLAGAEAPIAFSPDGTRIATAGDNNMVLLWNATTKQKIQTLKGFRYLIHTLAFSPDGKRLAAGDSGEYTVKLWDTVSGREVFTIPGITDRTDVASYALFFSPDGTRLYSGNQNDTIKVWEAE